MTLDTELLYVNVFLIGDVKFLGEFNCFMSDVICDVHSSSTFFLYSSSLGIYCFLYFFSSSLFFRKLFVIIRLISLKLCNTLRRGCSTWEGRNVVNLFLSFKLLVSLRRWSGLGLVLLNACFWSTDLDIKDEWSLRAWLTSTVLLRVTLGSF